MAVGNVLSQYEKFFEKATETQLFRIAKQSSINFLEQSGLKNKEVKAMCTFIVWAAQIGTIAEDGMLTEKQKNFAAKVIESLFNGVEMESVYAEMTKSSTEEEKAILKTIGSKQYGIEFLKLILAFVYIDGSINMELEEQLENSFGVALLSDLFNGMPGLAEYEEGENEEIEEKNTALELTENEKKVYESIEKNDRGGGLGADLYFELYGSWNLPKLTPDNGAEYFAIMEKNKKELNMTKEQFCDIVYSLAKRGIIKKTINWNGNELYSAGEVKAKDIRVKVDEVEKKYEEELNTWIIECKKAFSQHEKEIEKLKEEKVCREKEIRNKCSEQISNKQTKISENKQWKNEAEQELSTIGLFQREQKRKQRSIIDETTKNIKELQEEIIEVKSRCENELKALEEEIARKEKKVGQKIKIEVPFPEYMKIEGRLERVYLPRKEACKELIKVYLADGKWHTVNEMMEKTLYLKNMDIQKTTLLSAVSYMVKNGILIRKIEKREACFRLAEQCKREKPDIYPVRSGDSEKN